MFCKPSNVWLRWAFLLWINGSTWAILLTSFLILIVQKSSGCTYLHDSLSPLRQASILVRLYIISIEFIIGASVQPRGGCIFYEWISPCPSFHFLWGKSSIQRRRFLLFDAWFHHTAWTKTPACPFQTGLCHKKTKVDRLTDGFSYRPSF